MPVDQVKRSALSRLAKVADKLVKGDVIKQYAAICVRRATGAENVVEVLLITSRDTGRWVIPKGWGMAKKKPHEVAREEAWEEVGVRGEVKKKPFGYYTYVKKLRGDRLVISLVQVHLLNVCELEQDYPEKGRRDLQWFSPEEPRPQSMNPNSARFWDRSGGSPPGDEGSLVFAKFSN